MKKPSKRTLWIIGIVALIVIALMVRNSRSDTPAAGGLDAPGKQACDDFAAGYPKAETKPDRLTLADKVTGSSGKTDNKEIQQRAADMGSAASAGGADWKKAADDLTAACKNAGWTQP